MNAYYASPMGDIEITSVDHHISGVRFLTSAKCETSFTPVIEQCITGLEEYFLGGRKHRRHSYSLSSPDL